MLVYGILLRLMSISFFTSMFSLICLKYKNSSYSQREYNIGKHIFVSHSSKNTKDIHHLVQGLQEEGLEHWIASRDIQPGAGWATSIMNAIESSNVILLLLSESANSSQQVSREIEEAVRLNIPIIPVIMGSFKISKGLMYFINSHQWIDAANKPASEWIPKVISTLKPYNDSNKNLFLR